MNEARLETALDALAEIAQASQTAHLRERVDAARYLIEHYQWRGEVEVRQAEKLYWLTRARADVSEYSETATGDRLRQEAEADASRLDQ